eukprot:TRINITY_DN19842_c0_g1_i1.p1 TRINITY_DN19842_c0_g1~~TRINITY_DN19842_c0_g1_i1.p1  ORF type:complete len:233 (+),score=74.41 TRINITY_DN19842_c0_g1_i1:92-790(+)
MVLLTVLLAKGVPPCTRVQVVCGRAACATKAVAASRGPVWGQDLEVVTAHGEVTLELLHGEAVVGRGRLTIVDEKKYGYEAVPVDTGGEVMVSWAGGVGTPTPTPTSTSRRVTPLSAAEVVPGHGHADGAAVAPLVSSLRPSPSRDREGYTAAASTNPYTPLSCSRVNSSLRSPLRQMHTSFSSVPSSAAGAASPMAESLRGVLTQLRGMQAHMANLEQQQTRLERLVEELR